MSDFTQFGSGVEKGMALAQQAEQVAQQREQIEMHRQEMNVKQSDWLSNQISTILQTPNAQLRAANFRRLSTTARQLNIAIDPDISKLMGDEKFVNDAMQANSMIAGLPPDQKAKAWLSVTAGIGDATRFAKAVDDVGQLMTQRASLNVKSQGDPYEASKQLASLQTSIGNQLKPSADALSALQNIHGLSLENFNNLSAHMATIMLNKIADPGSVVREGEVASMNAATANNTLERVQQLLRNKIGGGKLSKDEWKTVLSAADIMGEVHANRIQRVKQAYEPALRGTALSIDQVFSGLPQASELGNVRELSAKALQEKKRTLNASVSQTQKQVPGAVTASAPEATAVPTAVPQNLTDQEMAIIQKYYPKLAERYQKSGVTVTASQKVKGGK